MLPGHAHCHAIEIYVTFKPVYVVTFTLALSIPMSHSLLHAISLSLSHVPPL
jgi:hypothetical protein